MSRKTLVDTVADQLLEQIIDGRYAVGEALPAEAEIAGEAGVSRLTVRESLKALRAQNVVRVTRGRGTYVNPPESWTSLEAMVRASDKSQGKGATSTQLLEVRRMIETGAAALAASRRTERDLQSLARHLRGMEDAAALNDVDAFVAADIAFHDVILRASGNILLPALYEPLGRLLSAGRRETSAVPEIQQNAIRMHREVTESLATGDPELSRAAMDRHMDQTSDDLREYVLHQR